MPGNRPARTCNYLDKQAYEALFAGGQVVRGEVMEYMGDYDVSKGHVLDPYCQSRGYRGIDEWLNWLSGESKQRYNKMLDLGSWTGSPFSHALGQHEQVLIVEKCNGFFLCFSDNCNDRFCKGPVRWFMTDPETQMYGCLDAKCLDLNRTDLHVHVLTHMQRRGNYHALFIPKPSARDMIEAHRPVEYLLNKLKVNMFESMLEYPGDCSEKNAWACTFAGWIRRMTRPPWFQVGRLSPVVFIQRTWRSRLESRRNVKRRI
jgi:hypothetical protein